MRTQPAPARMVWLSLMRPRDPAARQWLHLLDDEADPQILESVEPVLVVWSSLWPDRPHERIRFDIVAATSGCQLRWTLLAAGSRPTESNSATCDRGSTSSSMSSCACRTGNSPDRLRTAPHYLPLVAVSRPHDRPTRQRRSAGTNRSPQPRSVCSANARTSVPTKCESRVGGTWPVSTSCQFHANLAVSGLTLRSARGVTLVAAAVKVVFVWGSAAAQSEAGGECCQDEYADADEGDAYGSAAARRVRAGRVRCGHWVYGADPIWRTGSMSWYQATLLRLWWCRRRLRRRLG